MYNVCIYVPHINVCSHGDCLLCAVMALFLSVSLSLQGMCEPKAAELQGAEQGLLTPGSHQILDGVRTSTHSLMPGLLREP